MAASSQHETYERNNTLRENSYIDSQGGSVYLEYELAHSKVFFGITKRIDKKGPDETPLVIVDIIDIYQTLMEGRYVSL